MKHVMMSLLAVTIMSPVCAEPIPSQVKSNALVEAIAERGETCGSLARWQSLSLKGLALEDRRGWDDVKRTQLISVRSEKLEEMACDSALLNAWIDGAQKGFEFEMLPPYLIVYEAMASLETPPLVFTAVSLRTDRRPVVDAINAKLASLMASDQLAEGGKSWPEYIQNTRAHALEFVSQLEAEGGDQAAAWIAQSALIVEAWYDEEVKR